MQAIGLHPRWVHLANWRQVLISIKLSRAVGLQYLQGFSRQPLLYQYTRSASCAAAGVVQDMKPSRGSNKRGAQRSVELAVQLCSVGKKQLPRLQQALSEELHDAVRIGQAIPRRNQGRRRQTNLIAKLLRELDDEDRQRIEALASGLEHGRESSLEQGANDLAESWLAGLLANDRAVTEVINSFSSWYDLQPIRQMLRRCQQGSSLESEGPEEAQHQIADSKLRKKLRRDLQLLAAQYLQNPRTGPEQNITDEEGEDTETPLLWNR